jgi:hypothetical protein
MREPLQLNPTGILDHRDKSEIAIIIESSAKGCIAISKA